MCTPRRREAADKGSRTPHRKESNRHHPAPHPLRPPRHSPPTVAGWPSGKKPVVKRAMTHDLPTPASPKNTSLTVGMSVNESWLAVASCASAILPNEAHHHQAHNDGREGQVWQRKFRIGQSRCWAKIGQCAKACKALRQPRSPGHAPGSRTASG